MIKLVLKKGENEDEFIAAGAHYQGSWYKKYDVEGNWGSPSMDGKIPVELKISYDMDSTNVELEGRFGLEENSLRGPW